MFGAWYVDCHRKLFSSPSLAREFLGISRIFRANHKACVHRESPFRDVVAHVRVRIHACGTRDKFIAALQAAVQDAEGDDPLPGFLKTNIVDVVSNQKDLTAAEIEVDVLLEVGTEGCGRAHASCMRACKNARTGVPTGI